MSEKMIDITWDTDEMYPCLVVLKAADNESEYHYMVNASAPEELVEAFLDAESKYLSLHESLLSYLKNKDDE